jgi:hypothetical protein
MTCDRIRPIIFTAAGSFVGLLHRARLARSGSLGSDPERGPGGPHRHLGLLPGHGLARGRNPR